MGRVPPSSTLTVPLFPYPTLFLSYSMAYYERSGNFARVSGVDWLSDYAVAPAGEDLPVLHVSARDAEAYAQWLSEQSGHRYRLPSEAEFENVLRAGSTSVYPWGEGTDRKSTRLNASH